MIKNLNFISSVLLKSFSSNFSRTFQLMMLLLLILVILTTPLTIISPLLLKKAKENIKCSNKHYSDYLNNRCTNSFFINPTNKHEIVNTISSLDKNKSVGPDSVPYNILILLNNEIFNPLKDLFNLSLSSGIFPSVLEIAKLVLVYKKDSKLDYQNYRPIYLLSNIEKILEKLMHKHLYKSLNDKNILYVLDKTFPLPMN